METETERQGVFPDREARRGDKCKERETWVHGEGYRDTGRGRQEEGYRKTGRHGYMETGEGDRESETW